MSRTSFYDYCTQENRQELLREWDEKANLPLTVHSISSGSARRVWWMCEKKHRWQAKPCARVTRNTGCPYCKRTIPCQGETDLATVFPNLLAEWDYEKNAPLLPQQMMPASHKKVWWKCALGHEWMAQINSRARGSGCPVCKNRNVVVGYNDLQTTDPEVAKEWHPTKNGSLTPEQVLAGMHRKVWWQCAQGHEWQAVIVSRTDEKCGCPYCAGRKLIRGENDLATTHPQLASQWNDRLNGTLRAQDVTFGSNKLVWWTCEKGHEFEAQVIRRTRWLSRCPFCANRRILVGFNDLATVEPIIAREWHPTLNEKLTPQMFVSASHTKVWWKCSEGHVWKAMIYSRTGKQRYGCPVCAGRVSANKIKDYYVEENTARQSSATASTAMAQTAPVRIGCERAEFDRASFSV